ncbi:hypothetical protein Tco_0190344 [Tanacetum coccineum]
MNCFCGNPTVIRTSWTDTNPGRRFRSCSTNTCPIFSWVDPPMCARAMAIIPGLLRSRNALQSALNAMESGNRRLKICLICSFSDWAKLKYHSVWKGLALDDWIAAALLAIGIYLPNVLRPRTYQWNQLEKMAALKSVHVPRF